MPDPQPLPDLPPAARLLLRKLPFPRKTAIVDVGANPVTPAPYTPLLRAGGCTVTGFEPQPDAFAALQGMKGPDETYFPFAVGDGGRHDLHIFKDGGFTSLFPPYAPTYRSIARQRWSQLRSVEPIDTVALDDMPDLGPCDLLKIDIQGGEKMVFDHAVRSLAQTMAVVVELRYLQLYEGEPMLGGVDDSLRRQGFTLHKILFNKAISLPNSQRARLNRRRVMDQLVDGDAVYIRHPGTVADWTDGQVMHLALLAATVFESHSLVLWALDEAVRRGLCPVGLPAAYVDHLPDSLLSTGEKERQRNDAPARNAPPAPAAETGPEPARAAPKEAGAMEETAATASASATAKPGKARSAKPAVAKALPAKDGGPAAPRAGKGKAAR